MLTQEQKKEYQREYMRRKRSNTGSNTEDTPTSEGSNSGSNKPAGSNTGLTGPKTPDELRAMTYEEHNRRSWALAAKMKREDPGKYNAIIGPIVKDGYGDFIRWGCYGPTYSELWARTPR